MAAGPRKNINNKGNELQQINLQKMYKKER
jgi:hypothetical protein